MLPVLISKLVVVCPCILDEIAFLIGTLFGSDIAGECAEEVADDERFAAVIVDPCAVCDAGEIDADVTDIADVLKTEHLRQIEHELDDAVVLGIVVSHRMHSELFIAVQVFNRKLNIALIAAAAHLVAGVHVIVIKGDGVCINRTDISRQRIGNRGFLLAAFRGSLSGRGLRCGGFRDRGAVRRILSAGNERACHDERRKHGNYFFHFSFLHIKSLVHDECPLHIAEGIREHHSICASARL